jgi:hypothetical protein
MVDIAATDWTGGFGRINKDVIMKGLPHPSHDTLILVGKLTITPTISFFFHNSWLQWNLLWITPENAHHSHKACMALSHYSRYRKCVVSLQVSGPPGLVEHVCGDKEDEDSQGELAGLLKEIGYKMEQVYKF